MASTMDNQFQDGLAARDDIEKLFLTYVACRIDFERGRVQQGKQSEAETRAHISELADLALDILGSRDEVEAWLKAASRATGVVAAGSFSWVLVWSYEAVRWAETLKPWNATPS